MSNNVIPLKVQAIPGPRLSLAQVRSKFRIHDNDVTRDTTEISQFKRPNKMPLTSYRGPHSDHIAAQLQAHPKLGIFAQGVDERAIYSYEVLVHGFERVNFSYLNDDAPLVFGFHDQARNCHEVSCVKITETICTPMDSEFEIRVFGVLDIVQAADGTNFLDYFVDLEDPIVLHYRPEEGTVKTDIDRTRHASTLSCGEFIARLCYLAEVLGDENTHLAQLCDGTSN